MARSLMVVLLAATCFVAASCGGSDGGGDDGPATISFLIFGDPPELKAYRDIIAAYRKVDPDTTVKLIEASDRDDLIARLSTSIAGGSPPDLFLLNYRYYGQFAAKGAREPLEERFAESEAFEEDDFFPEPLASFRWDGTLMCLPQNVSSLVVYYNRDLFKRFGVPEPRPNWTWLDFVRTASALTRDENGMPIQGQDPDLPTTTGPVVRPAVYGAGIETILIRLAPFAWSNGGDIVDDPERPTRLTLSDPNTLAALREFSALRIPYGVIPTDNEVESEDDETRFVNGRLAMLFDSRRAVPSLRAAAKFDWDVATLPRFKRPASILHSDGYCMTKASKQKDAAWRFVEFALGPEGQEIVARTGRTVPSIRAVAESRAFLDPRQKPRSSKVWLDAIEHVRPVPTISTWPEVEDVVDGLIENGVYLGQPIDQVAAKADEQTRELFERAER